MVRLLPSQAFNFYRIGEKVPFGKKGRYGVVFGSVKDQFFSLSHVDIETSSVDDITAANINKLVSNNQTLYEMMSYEDFSNDRGAKSIHMML